MKAEHSSSNGVVGFLLGALALSPSSAGATDVRVDLVVYGDTRGGFWQASSNGLRAHQIHGALTEALGAMSDLAERRAILFLGDAVSQAGCHEFWTDKFHPALRNLKAFARKDGAYFFYPVIGDHETYLIPENPEEEDHVPPRCVLFRNVYPGLYKALETTNLAGMVKGTKGERTGYANLAESERLAFDSLAEAQAFRDRWPQMHRELYENALAFADTQGQVEDCRILQGHGCELADAEKDPMLMAHCAICRYQRDVCAGNCVTYAFKKEYSADNHFEPFQEAWQPTAVPGEGAPRAARTWYALDYDVGTTGSPRTLRILMLDTQTSPTLSVSDGGTQTAWMRASLRALPEGSLVIAIGHQPPAMKTRLYETVLQEAASHKHRVLAIVSAHYHGFGGGAYEVGKGGRSAKMYLGVSGDGGSRDFGLKERVTEDRMFAGGAIGSFGVRATAVDGWRRDEAKDAVSYLRLRLKTNAMIVEEYSLPIGVEKGAGGAVVAVPGTPKRERSIAIPY